MLELPLCCEVCELPTGELGSVVRDKDIRDTVTVELHFHELDYGCRVGVLEWADFNKVKVVVYWDYVVL